MAVAKTKQAEQTAGERRPGAAAAKTGPGTGSVAEFTKDEELQALRSMLLDPPLRGKGRPDVWHGPDRRFLPSLYRPGGRRRRHEDGQSDGDQTITGYRDHGHMLACGIDPKGVMAELTGRARRLFQGQGRLDAHVLPREQFLRRAWHRRRAGAARHRACLRQSTTAATTMSASPISATAPPIRARSTRASIWRSCGSCRSSTSSRTTATRWARR